MRNRFAKKRRWDLSFLRGLALPVGLFIAVLFLFRAGVEQLSQTARQEQLRSAQQAVYRACIQCYVLEGQYPPSVEYLVEDYGLQVDLDTYIVHYEVFAGNLMPNIQVMHRYF